MAGVGRGQKVGSDNRQFYEELGPLLGAALTFSRQQLTRVVYALANPIRFWKFSMSRRQRTKAQAEGAPDPMPPPEVQRDLWKSQVAGLQQKAAAKRAAGRRARPAPAAGSGGPAARDTSDVWRSTTKNARRAPPPAAAPSAGAGSFSGSGRAADGGLPGAAVGSAAAQAQRDEAPAPQQMAAAAAAPSAAPAPEGEGQQQQQPPLHEVLSHAVHAVHRRRQQHDVAVREHTQRLASHIVALSQHLRSRLLPALHLPSLATVAGIPFSGLRSRAEAARQAPLHVLFGDEVRGRERPAADAEAGAAAAPASDGSAADASSAGGPWGHRPSARFANSSDVKERYTLQLAGLRRRAALKQEVLAEE